MFYTFYWVTTHKFLSSYPSSATGSWWESPGAPCCDLQRCIIKRSVRRTDSSKFVDAYNQVAELSHHRPQSNHGTPHRCDVKFFIFHPFSSIYIDLNGATYWPGRNHSERMTAYRAGNQHEQTTPDRLGPTRSTRYIANGRERFAIENLHRRAGPSPPSTAVCCNTAPVWLARRRADHK